MAQGGNVVNGSLDWAPGGGGGLAKASDFTLDAILLHCQFESNKSG